MKFEDNSSDSYFLSEPFFGGNQFKIEFDWYSKINDAISMLVAAANIEDLFQVFARSFIGFEKDQIDVAFDFAYGHGDDDAQELLFGSIRHRYNVNILTILTAYKSYDDTGAGILKSSKLFADPLAHFCQKRAEIYDAYLAYRVCSKLRNYAQHRALPLGGFSIGGNAEISNDEDGRKKKGSVSYNISPWLDLVKFKASSQCKSELKLELSGMPYEKMGMKWLMRSFAEAMYIRHSALRNFLTPAVALAAECISEAYRFASAEKGGEVLFLELVGGGKSRNLKKDLGALISRSFTTYQSLNSATRIYITSRIEKTGTIYNG